MPAAPRVSVIVPVRDDAQGAGELARALAAQTLGADAVEVVLVDDGSRDAAALATAVGGAARIERLDRSRGSYAARNHGLTVTTAPVVAFTDADCRPRADWLERGLRAVEDGRGDLVGGRIDTPLSVRPTVAETIDAARGLDQRRCVEEWGFAATANLLVRRSVLDEVGAFNERLRSGGDDELSRRAVAAGFRLVYADDVVVGHRARRRAREVARKALRVGYGGGRLRHVATGPAAHRPRLWTDVRAWRPRRDLLGIDRLEAAGLRPGGRQRARLAAAQWAWVQVPTATGDLLADLHAWIARGS